MALALTVATSAEVRLLRFAEARQFRMGTVVSHRIVHPEMGAKRLTLNFSASEPGHEFAQHAHDESDDTILILQGAGDLRQGDSRRRFTAGQSAFVPAGQIHGTVTAGTGSAIMISFQTPPDMALYSGVRDSSLSGAAPPKGVITPGAVKFVEFVSRNGLFVHPGMGAARISVAHWRLKQGKRLSSKAPPDTEQVLFVWKGSIVVRCGAERLPVAARDAVLAAGPAELEVLNESPTEAILIQAQAPPTAARE
jgi:quercetin dioxygenase-like cupin family protein